jgi:hypothetical protein
MSSDNSAAQLAGDIGSMQSEVNSLESKARLSDTRSALAEFETSVSGLPQRIVDMRSHGYVFEKDLEQRASDYAGQWATLRATIEQHVDQEAAALGPDLRALELQMTQLNTWSGDSGVAQPLLAQSKNAASALDERISGVDRTVSGMYDAFKGVIDKFSEHLSRIEWTLVQLAEASFRLMPAEGGVMAVPAVWCRQGKQAKDDPEGILFLTDQRVLFEQKQEIVTKKVLFVATQKQKVQKLLLDVPVGKADSAKGSKLGLMGHEDHIEINFGSGAPVRVAHFHINGQDCNEWQGLIGRAKGGDFDHDRPVAPDAAQVERVKSAPTKCPSCGGAISQTVVRGMDSLTCEFCGTVIRL